MANGFDRLERLFTSKRKPYSDPSRPSSSAAVQPSSPQFPSPSFIRPKTTRMAARDEVRLRQLAGRSPSVPDIAATRRTVSSFARDTKPTVDVSRPDINIGPPPALAQQQMKRLASLRDAQLSRPSSRHDRRQAPAFQPSTRPKTPPPGDSESSIPPSHSPRKVAVLPNRLHTPPSSGPDDSSRFFPDFATKFLTDATYNAPPTPEETPEFGPVSDILLRGSKSLDVVDKSILKNKLNDSSDRSSLQRSYSQSSLALSAQLSFCSSTLREPDFNEFLNLSDDDIAESTPESLTPPALNDHQPVLPPMDLSISSALPLTSSLLTLTPPRSSRPATAAAYEAARIAQRYDFDLVYVVNLWPDNSQAHGPGKKGNLCVDQKPMMGRLLAAHGLHHVPSPLQISSLVHTTILRADGWIEYRNQEAQGQDLARGFAYSFYTGHYTRNGQPHTQGPVSGVRLSEQIDRGIVFAAYRKPRQGEERLGRTFSEDDLGELHREAEALVEMLIDIHVANRLRHPPSNFSVVDETGPMPQ